MDGSAFGRVRSGDVAHQNASPCVRRSAPAAAPASGRGIGQPRCQAARAQYQATIAGIARRHEPKYPVAQPNWRRVWPMPGAQQPAVQPDLLDAGPGRGGRVLERPDLATCAPVRRSAPAARPRRRARTRRPRPSWSAPAPPGRPPAGVPPHRSAAGPIRRGAGSEPSPACPRSGHENISDRTGPALRPAVHDRPGTPQPCDLTARFALRACRPIRRSRYRNPSRCPVSCCSMRANRPVPSMVTGLPSASRPVTRAQLARPVGNDSPGTDRQPSSSVVRVGHGLGYFGGFQDRIDDHAAAAVASLPRSSAQS